MAKYNPDEVNSGFTKYFPELTAVYTLYPMQEDKWLNTGETVDGEKVFVRSEKDTGLKKNYVYCTRVPAGTGKGYYHVLTKTAHTNLYNRGGNTPPIFCGCPVGSKAKKDFNDWNTARLTIYNRTRSSKPNDYEAAKQAIAHMI